MMAGVGRPETPIDGSVMQHEVPGGQYAAVSTTGPSLGVNLGYSTGQRQPVAAPSMAMPVGAMQQMAPPGWQMAPVQIVPMMMTAQPFANGNPTAAGAMQLIQMPAPFQMSVSPQCWVSPHMAVTAGAGVASHAQPAGVMAFPPGQLMLMPDGKTPMMGMAATAQPGLQRYEQRYEQRHWPAAMTPVHIPASSVPLSASPNTRAPATTLALRVPASVLQLGGSGLAVSSQQPHMMMMMPQMMATTGAGMMATTGAGMSGQRKPVPRAGAEPGGSLLSNAPANTHPAAAATADQARLLQPPRESHPYRCTYEGCHETFLRPSLLSKHAYVHTGDRPFTCTVCSQGFRTKWTLKKHGRTHTGEKPFSCADCNRAFSQRGSWRRHVFVRQLRHCCWTIY